MSYFEIVTSIGFGPHDSRYEVLTDVNLSVEENEFVTRHFPGLENRR